MSEREAELRELTESLRNLRMQHAATSAAVAAASDATKSSLLGTGGPLNSSTEANSHQSHRSQQQSHHSQHSTTRIGRSASPIRSSPARRLNLSSTSGLGSTNMGPGLNSSFTGLGNVSLSNSKAVLGALRSLQDKIRRLESERQFYKEGYALLEAELERAKAAREADRTANLNATSRLEESIAMVQANAEEKTSHHVEELRVARKEIEWLKSVVERANAEKSSAQSAESSAAARIRDLEADLAEWKNRAERAEDAERSAREEIADRERSHLEQSREEADARRSHEIAYEAKLAQLEARIAALDELKVSVESGARRTEESLRSVLSMNEQLLKSREEAFSVQSSNISQQHYQQQQQQQQQQPTSARGTATNGNYHDQAQSQGPPPTIIIREVPVAAPSVSSARAGSASQKKKGKRVTVKSQSAAASRLTSGVRRTASPKRKVKRAASAPHSSPAGGKTTDRLPWVPTTRPGPSHSVTANIQQILSNVKAHPDSASTEQWLSEYPSAVASGLADALDDSGALDTSIDPVESNRAGAKEVVYSALLDDDAQLAEVVSTLEKEFSSLSSQYQGLSRAAQAESEKGDQENPAIAQSLQVVVEQLELKGRQLTLLRKHQRELRDQLASAARSAAVATQEDVMAARRVATLRLLHDFRELAAAQPS